MYSIFLYFLFLLLSLMTREGMAADPVDFSSPRAQFCFAERQFSAQFPEIRPHELNGKSLLDVYELENTYLLKDHEARYPSSLECDGQNVTDCSACYKSVESMLIKRALAFQSFSYVAPKNKKKLVIVGAGPAGLRAAIDSAMMGYDVSLFESRSDFTRGKNLGMFSLETKFLASLGMPASMVTNYMAYFSDGVHKKKAAMPLKIKQKFLKQVAQKLGVTIFQGCEVLTDPSIHYGFLKILPNAQKCVQIERGHEQAWFNSFVVTFDRIIIANGASSRLRNRVLKANKVTFGEMAYQLLKSGKLAKEDLLEMDGSEFSYYNSFLEPTSANTGGFENFVPFVLNGNKLTGKSLVFVSDMDVRIFGNSVPVPNINPLNLGSNWAVLPMSKLFWDTKETNRNPVSREERWHIEGNLPLSFSVNGQEIGTKEDLILPHFINLKMRNLFLSRLAREIFSLFSASGLIKEEHFQLFLKNECGKDQLADNGITLFDIEDMRTTLTDPEGKEMKMAGKLDHSDAEYFIVGDAFMDPWYSFGIGLHNGMRSIVAIHRALAAGSVFDKKAIQPILEFEKNMRKQVIQVLLQIYNANTESKSDHIHKILEKLYKAPKDIAANMTDFRSRL